MQQVTPHTSRFVEAGEVKLHYLDYGTEGRPPMLCVHGGAAHAHWFDFVAPALTSKYHVRSVDLRGHGDSAWVEPPEYTYATYAADLEAFAEKLDLRDFVLVGHSMGGTVCLLYAAMHPERVGKLVIVDSTVNLSPERIAALRDIGSRSGSQYDSLDELVKRYRLRPGISLAPAETVEYIARHSARESPDGKWRHKFDRNVYATRELFDGMPYWSRIRAPTLLVKGDHSDRISQEIFERVKAECPQAVLAEVKASGHHVTLDNPNGFVEALNRFLDAKPTREMK
jgi:pimeloyl-ACP methyl ester carboxylesterase